MILNILTILALSSGNCVSINNYNDMVSLNRPYQEDCYQKIINNDKINYNNRCCLNFLDNIECKQNYINCIDGIVISDASTLNTNNSNKNLFGYSGFILTIVFSGLNFIAIIILVYIYRNQDNNPNQRCNRCNRDILRRDETIQPVSYTNPLYGDSSSIDTLQSYDYGNNYNYSDGNSNSNSNSNNNDNDDYNDCYYNDDNEHYDKVESNPETNLDEYDEYYDNKFYSENVMETYSYPDKTKKKSKENNLSLNSTDV